MHKHLEHKELQAAGQSGCDRVKPLEPQKTLGIKLFEALESDTGPSTLKPARHTTIRDSFAP